MLFSLGNGIPSLEQGHFNLMYYDGLANQDEKVVLRVSQDLNKTRINEGSKENSLCSPLECVIRTKWQQCTIEWKKTDPIL